MRKLWLGLWSRTYVTTRLRDLLITWQAVHPSAVLRRACVCMLVTDCSRPDLPRQQGHGRLPAVRRLCAVSYSFWAGPQGVRALWRLCGVQGVLPYVVLQLRLLPVLQVL